MCFNLNNSKVLIQINQVTQTDGVSNLPLGKINILTFLKYT